MRCFDLSPDEDIPFCVTYKRRFDASGLFKTELGFTISSISLIQNQSIQDSSSFVAATRILNLSFCEKTANP